jgi:hypothetical protein
MSEAEGSERERILAEFQNVVSEALAPYGAHINESFQRAYGLGRHAATLIKEPNPWGPSFKKVSDDIYRSVVVITHAYLEDFLRTLGKAFLPLAEPDVLNNIPLAGCGGSNRKEKFPLGSLAQHKGKLVEEVISESVTEYLGRLSFNSTDDIMTFIKQVGLFMPPDSQLPEIEAMIKRRHQIVHRADRIDNELQAVDADQILKWVEATNAFMHRLLVPILLKHYPPEVLANKYQITIFGKGKETPTTESPATTSRLDAD